MKYVYAFKEGSKDMRSLLGGKGANLAEMSRLGMPVPQGFTVTTEACNKYYEDGGTVSDEIIEQIHEYMQNLEEITGKKFGSTDNPLLVSVRSGAVFSMPGMMDTILNLGLNDEAVAGFAELTGNERFAYDSYRRFIQMFGDVVQEIKKSKFDAIFDAAKVAAGAKFDVDLSAEDLKAIIADYKKLVEAETGKPFPQDPEEQLIEAVKAVFRSWNNERAILYRELNNIPGDLGTAVNVQSMVFGNTGDTSGTGVAFTRNPATGENGIFGEFLVNAQGEDVVAGVRTPQPIKEMENAFPEVYKEFLEIADKLENHYKDMQDMEFTVENNKLYMLQTRNGKRTAAAAVKVAVEMVAEGLIDKKTAVMRLEPDQIEQLLHPAFDAAELKAAQAVATGLAASPGAACGRIYFTAGDAEEAHARGEKVLLVRRETSPEDLAGMVAAEGILTATGGMTSHAAVVARGMGKCCVSGCSQIEVYEEAKELYISGVKYVEGDYISIDGSTGKVYIGEIKTVVPELSGDFGTLMSWADEIKTLGVRTNADTPADAAQAVEFGAEGIGLCRTEHMFFNEERIPAIRGMIMANTPEERSEAINRLLPFQKADFKGIYEAMGERPVTIRLLDPPLHEFIPKTDEEMAEFAKQIGLPLSEVQERADSLREQNPMLGHRGCRLAISYPELPKMQALAIISAAREVREEKGYDIVPEIMIPLVSMKGEMKYVKQIIVDTVEEYFKNEGISFDYLVGTMMETPRGCLRAGEIAEEADFFSFGTNDLTQMSFGFSRDDTGDLIKEYIERELFQDDPFSKLDRRGVGRLVKMAVEDGRETNPKLKLGICGEHGGNPTSIEFCNSIGLNYVSCSPYRVPIARLAAAQAAIKASDNK